MTTITYESLKAEQAWLTASEQLQQRNMLLGRGIAQLEQYPNELPMASRLMILRYHLRHSLRQLAQEGRQLKADHRADSPAAGTLHYQWQHVHQLFFLLRQIDIELHKARASNDALHTWLGSINPKVYKSALMYMN